MGLRLWMYQALVLLQFAAVLALLIWLFRPVGVRRAMAACVALSCVRRACTASRILFGFWPLNHHSGGLVLLLVATRLPWIQDAPARLGLFSVDARSRCCCSNRASSSRRSSRSYGGSMLPGVSLRGVAQRRGRGRRVPRHPAWPRHDGRLAGNLHELWAGVFGRQSGDVAQYLRACAMALLVVQRRGDVPDGPGLRAASRRLPLRLFTAPRRDATLAMASSGVVRADHRRHRFCPGRLETHVDTRSFVARGGCR